MKFHNTDETKQKKPTTTTTPTSKQEAEFLATLSQAPQPSGRRHSVVTISKVPFSVFGRSRRESVAAFPAGGR